MNKKNLLFFFSDEECPESTAVVPTLSALAAEMDIDFDTYICTRPQSWGGKTLPFTGHLHNESFYYLANFYDKILFLSLSSYKSFQFKREIMAWGGDIVSCRSNDEILEFYKDVYEYFGRPIPTTAGVIPDRPDETATLVKGKPWLAPYFYYDIFKSQSLGISETVFNSHQDKLLDMGVTSAISFGCFPQKSEIEIKPGYDLAADCGYGELTSKIAERWCSSASGLSYGDGNTVSRWMAYFIRENLIPLYEPFEWTEFVPTISNYAKKIGNPLIVGCQNVYPHNTDNVMAEFAKYGMFFNLLGTDPRHGFSIQKKHQLPLDWLADAPSPWDDEYSDDFLRQKIEEKATPFCFLFYAADLGHLPVLPRVLDLMGQDGNRAGLAFPSVWYDYHPELLEQIYIPLQQGGVFPQLEPMLSSGGSVVACEAEGMIQPDMLTSLLKDAKKDIEGKVGKAMLPRGYYPWQDASPFYRRNSGTPQFDAVAEAGFEYYVSYLDSDMPGKILYDKNGMLAFNQQVPQWFPGAGDPEDVVRKFDQEACSRSDKENDYADWVVLPFDMPFFGLSPVYLNGEAWHERFNGKIMGMQPIAKAMKYVRNGGSCGKIFMLKPHELFRYIRLLQELKLR